MDCLNCNKALKSKFVKKYCSRRCAAIINNKAKPKRVKKERPKCRECNNRVDHFGVVYCRECISNRKHFHGIPADLQTIEQASKRGGANKYDLIRSHARRKYRKELEGSCEKCNYNKHVELCHINAISSFPKDTLVEVVNRRDNVMFLCPNCHWELDHGLL
jgi:hypothetical protein